MKRCMSLAHTVFINTSCMVGSETDAAYYEHQHITSDM